MTTNRIEPAVGDTVDRRYLLRRELGKGGMATVFEAAHVITGRRVAIKLVAAEDPYLRQRLFREASVLGQARHPSIVEVLDAGEDVGGFPFIVLELLEGRSLEGILAARRTLPVADVVSIGLDLCGALAFAHEHKLLHRDVKPGNVFLVPEPPGSARAATRAKLIDFGIVAVPDVSDADSKLTGASDVPGTPEYMAPEHLRGEVLDACADLYALGVTMFECLTGEVPFSGGYMEVLTKVLTKSAPPSLRAARRDVPVALAEAIERAMAHERTARFPDVSAFAVALRRIPGVQEADVGRPPVEQRRTYARAPYGTPVRLVRTGNEPLDGRSEDISEGGMFVLADRAATVGERAEVRFALPITGTIARVSGHVRWVRPARGDKAAVGFEFRELTDDARQAIAAYVRWMSPDAAAAVVTS